MLVICPNCQTKFAFPDSLARAGARCRCSVCKEIFVLPEDSDVLELTTPVEDTADTATAQVVTPVPEQKQEAEQKQETEANLKPEAEVETAPEMKTEPEADTEAEFEPETGAELEVEPEAEPEEEPLADANAQTVASQGDAPQGVASPAATSALFASSQLEKKDYSLDNFEQDFFGELGQQRVQEDKISAEQSSEVLGTAHGEKSEGLNVAPLSLDATKNQPDSQPESNGAAAADEMLVALSFDNDNVPSASHSAEAYSNDVSVSVEKSADTPIEALLEAPLDAADAPMEMASAPAPKSHTGRYIVVAFLVLLVAAMAFVHFAPKAVPAPVMNMLRSVPFVAEHLQSEEAPKAEPSAQDVTGIVLRNVRQYIVMNVKAGGRIIIIEGQVANTTPYPRKAVLLEGILLGEDGKSVISQEQYSGIEASLYQLQELNKAELSAVFAAENAKEKVLSMGAEMPFMMAFFVPNATVKEFSVRVISAEAEQ